MCYSNDLTHGNVLNILGFVGPGVYHGALKFDGDAESHIDGAALLPYPAQSDNSIPENPLSLSLTEFHFILLYKDRVIGICNLDDKLTYEETLPLVSATSTIVASVGL